jgi:hypothetical protein
MASSVFGNLISALILGNLDQRYYVLIIIAFISIGCFIFFFLKNPIVQRELIVKSRTEEKLSLNNQTLITNVPPA